MKALLWILAGLVVVGALVLIAPQLPLPLISANRSQEAGTPQACTPIPKVVPTTAPTIAPTIEPTVCPPTPMPPTAAPTIAPTAQPPTLFDAPTCPPEDKDGCSFDIGIKQGQVGIAFGWGLQWGNLNLSGGCNMVILWPGFYENFHLTDARVEIYNIYGSDYTGWVKVLAEQRRIEQAKDYDCNRYPNFDSIPQLSSGISSPPQGVPGF